MRKHKWVVGVAVALGVLLVVALFCGAMAWVRAPYAMHGGMMGGFRSPYGMHSFGGIGLVLFGVLLLGGIALLVAGLSHGGKAPAGQEETALEILQRRYASGELDREEFERIKEALQG